jgi:hypothetical protein
MVLVLGPQRKARSGGFLHSRPCTTETYRDSPTPCGNLSGPLLRLPVVSGNLLRVQMPARTQLGSSLPFPTFMRHIN